MSIDLVFTCRETPIVLKECMLLFMYLPLLLILVNPLKRPPLVHCNHARE